MAAFIELIPALTGLGLATRTDNQTGITQTDATQTAAS